MVRITGPKVRIGQRVKRVHSADIFEKHRSLLFTIAYEITGLATDAEDAVQDTYLRWSNVFSQTIENPRAYLAKIVTRQALNTLRSRQRRREDYVGPWLPEPVSATLDTSDVSDDLILRESLSIAMLVVLETLTPDERAVFVLREVFDFPYAEIAEATDKSATTVRQIAHRAREHVRSRRPRFDVDPCAQQLIADRFIAALGQGDMQSVMDLLAPGAVLLSDGGGKVTAARKPVIGAEHVAQFLFGISNRPLPGMRIEQSVLNGLPALLIYSDGRINLAAIIQSQNGQVSGVYLVRNPDKLTTIGTKQIFTR